MNLQLHQNILHSVRDILFKSIGCLKDVKNLKNVNGE